LLEKNEDVQPEIVPGVHSQPNYFLILNNDTSFDQNFLLELAAAANRHKKAGVIAPKIYFMPDSLPKPVLDENKNGYTLRPGEQVLWFAGGLFDWDNILGSHRGVDQVDHGQYNQEEQIPYATGCALLIPFQVMKKVKGFDSKYFMYYEDVDLNMRIKKAGYEIWYAPQAVMWHSNASSSGVGSPLQDYYSTRNRILFAFKFASLRTKIAIIKEAFRFRSNQVKWKAVTDFFLARFEKGSFEIK
jgi:GT2 family glycosyltransferase